MIIIEQVIIGIFPVTVLSQTFTIDYTFKTLSKLTSFAVFVDCIRVCSERGALLHGLHVLGAAKYTTNTRICICTTISKIYNIRSHVQA